LGRWNIEWTPWNPPGDLAAVARELARAKYSTACYNERR
jgi:hypothetical protein